MTQIAGEVNDVILVLLEVAALSLVEVGDHLVGKVRDIVSRLHF